MRETPLKQGIPPLLATALAFYRAPSRYAALSDARVPLPGGVSALLSAYAGALADDRIAETAERLGSSPQECRAAVTFFIKQALLEAHGTHYRTLGVAREANAALIRQHYHYLIRLFHPDRDFDSEGWDNLYAPLINAAWNALRTPAKRQQYDATLPPADAFDALFTSGAQQTRPAPAGRVAVAPTSSSSAGAAAWGNAFGVLPRLRHWSLPAVAAMVLLGAASVLLLLWREQPTAGSALRVANAVAGPVAEEQGHVRPAVQALDNSTAAHGAVTGGADAVSSGHLGLHHAAISAPLSEREIEAQVQARLAAARRAVLGPERSRPAAQSIAQSPEPSPQVAISEPKVQVATPMPPPVPELELAASSLPLPEPEPAASSPPSPEPELAASSPPSPQPEPAASSPPLPETRLPPIAPTQLSALLRAFAATYEQGNASGFSALFADDAQTTEVSGRDSIRSHYAAFFARPERRQLEFRRMAWASRNAHESRGVGNVHIVTVPHSGGEVAKVDVAITLQVVQGQQGPLITGMFYR